ncbi:MAG: DUF1559 domain-containing protein, partial [Planctomycetota bacterium]
ALLLPAVQAAREAARKMQCGTQLRELGQAALAFEAAKKHFPGWQEIVARNSGAPIGGSGPNKVAGWPVLLLPYLDQNALFDVWDDQNQPATGNPTLDPFLPIYSCPSRGTEFRTAAYTSYVANAGFSNAPGTNDSKAATGPYWDLQHDKNTGVFLDRVPFNTGANVGTLQPANLNKVTTTDINDGLSNTLLFTENLLGGKWNHANAGGYGTMEQCEITFHWMAASDKNPTICNPVPGAGIPNPIAEMKINGHAAGVTRPAADPTLLATVDAWKIAAHPSSWHSGGVNVVFADKHTLYLSQQIDYDVYQQLMTTYGKKSQMPCKAYVLRAQDFDQ